MNDDIVLFYPELSLLCDGHTTLTCIRIGVNAFNAFILQMSCSDYTFTMVELLFILYMSVRGTMPQ